MSARQRAGRIPSAHFLVLVEAQQMNDLLRDQGFALNPFCKPRAHGNHLTVCLVWQRASQGEMCILRLRVRLPRDPADG